MSTEEHRRRLAQLGQQQAWITRALAAMAEGRWVGEASVEAYLLALDPGLADVLEPRVPLYEAPAPPERVRSDCWGFWSSASMARATNCPHTAVETNWPAIHAELERRGVATQNVCAAVLATIAVETAHTFAPVQEAFWLDDGWRHANLRYAPHWGRGYVQLTWDYNYHAYGTALGIDLINNVDRAMEPDIAAAILAEYFVRAKVAEAAERRDWREVRRRVQGGVDGLDELLRVINELGCN
jgi:predicted chitinase